MLPSFNCFMARTAHRNYIKPMFLFVSLEVMVMNCRFLFTNGTQKSTHLWKISLFNCVADCFTGLFFFHRWIIFLIKEFALFAFAPFLTTFLAYFWMSYSVRGGTYQNIFLVALIVSPVQLFPARLTLRAIAALLSCHSVKFRNRLDFFANGASFHFKPSFHFLSAANRIKKSLRASPESMSINSLCSSSFARSRFQKDGKRAGFRPAPVRLPPWVLGLETIAMTRCRRLVSVGVIGGLCQLLTNAATRIRGFIVAPVIVGVVGFKNTCTARAIPTIFSASSVPRPLAALPANKRRFSVLVSFKCFFEFFGHRLISFLDMNTVYTNQDRMSRGNL